MQDPLRDIDQLGLRSLPGTVETLLASVGAPPRLIAHLTLVHDVALELC